MNNQPTTPAGGEIREDSARASEFVVRPEVELAEAFGGLTRQLRRRYPIDKGVLVLRDQHCRLAAISTYNQGLVREGLTLNLPSGVSLFEKVAEDGRVYTEEFVGSFSGNFFERKLLLDDDSRCFVVQPLKSDGRVMGLLGYSSRCEGAFVTFDEGALDEIAGRFGSMIEGALNRRV